MLRRLSEIDAAIQASWAADTCSADDAERRPWSSDNPAWGHCDVSALVVNDLLGGELMVAEVHLGDEQLGYHWWNRLSGGVEIDLTRDQFTAGETLTEAQTVARSHPFPRDRKQEYLLFRDRVEQRLGSLPAPGAASGLR